MVSLNLISLGISPFGPSLINSKTVKDFSALSYYHGNFICQVRLLVCQTYSFSSVVDIVSLFNNISGNEFVHYEGENF